MLLALALVSAACHAVAGTVFAVAFLWRGLAVVDSAAARGTFGFRLLIAPGAAALWPVMLCKWVSASRRRA